MKIAMFAALAVLSSSVGACGSAAIAPEAGDDSTPEVVPAGIGHVSQAITYPWVNYTVDGYLAPASMAIPSVDPFNQICGIQWMRGPFYGGIPGYPAPSVINVGLGEIAGGQNKLVASSAPGRPGPAVGAVCAQNTAFSFTGATNPVTISADLGNVNATSRVYSRYGTGQHLPAQEWQGNHEALFAQPFPVMQHLEGWNGNAATATSVSSYMQFTFAQGFTDLHTHDVPDCFSTPQYCGQDVQGRDYIFRDAHGVVQTVAFPVKDHLLGATSTGAQVTYNTFVPATDGMCFITSAAWAWEDVADQAFVYVGAGGYWYLAVQGPYAAAAVSCVNFAN